MADTREFEYADIKVKLLGAELDGFRGLTYKLSQEKELVYGQGNKAKAIQKGNEKNEGTLMMLKSDFDVLQGAAVSAGYQSLVKVPGKLINIVCVYQKKGDPIIQTATMLNVEFTDVEDGMKQGDKFKEISLPFICLDIVIV